MVLKRDLFFPPLDRIIQLFLGNRQVARSFSSVALSVSMSFAPSRTSVT